MSFLKATWWRPATALAVLALAVLALSLSGSGTAQAGGDGSVSLTPNPREIGVGGTGTVAVELTPGAAGTSIWIIQAKYDPTVAEVAVDGFGNPVCVNATAPAGFETAFATGCDTKDTDATLGPDTIVVFGGAVKNVNQAAVGLTAPITLATFTFEAVGAADTHTDLTMTGSCQPSPCASFLSPAGDVQTPTANNGRINITAATGTSRQWGDADCDGSVAPRDSQAGLKHFLNQAELSQTPPCPGIGSTITFDGTSHLWGDNDCDGAVAPRDGQAGLKHFLSQAELSQTQPCPVLGTTGQVSP